MTCDLMHNLLFTI